MHILIVKIILLLIIKTKKPVNYTLKLLKDMKNKIILMKLLLITKMPSKSIKVTKTMVFIYIFLSFNSIFMI